MATGVAHGQHSSKAKFKAQQVGRACSRIKAFDSPHSHIKALIIGSTSLMYAGENRDYWCLPITNQSIRNPLGFGG